MKTRFTAICLLLLCLFALSCEEESTTLYEDLRPAPDGDSAALTDDDDDITEDGDEPADDDDDITDDDDDITEDGDEATDDDDDLDGDLDGDITDDDDDLDGDLDGDIEDEEADEAEESEPTCAQNQCEIEGECWDHNQTNPDADCTYCDVAVDRTEWSNKLAGTECEDGRECTSGETCAEGGICQGGHESHCPWVGESCPTEDERVCVHHTVLLCGQDLTWELVQVCGDSGLYCQDGQCVEREGGGCVYGEDPTRCNGDISEACHPDGYWTTLGNCPYDDLRCWLGHCWHPDDYPVEED